MDYFWGCAGILIAVLGLGVRTTLIQVLQMERGEALQRETLALKTIAWTDALTGIPNRLFFTEALGRLWRGERSRERPAICCATPRNPAYGSWRRNCVPPC